MLEVRNGENGAHRPPGPPTGNGLAGAVSAPRFVVEEPVRGARPRARLSTSVVIPALNEARNLTWVLEQMPSWVQEVVLVDGRSTDATVEMAMACRPDIRIVAQQKTGKGAALREGFEAATGEVLVMMDADGSMSPGELPRYLHFLEEGYDFVKGSRFVAGGGSLDMTPLRRQGNQALMRMVRTMYHHPLTDLCYGYIAFRRRFLRYMDLRCDGFDIETEMVLRAIQGGLRIAEVPSLELPRRSGRSHLNTFEDGWRVMRTVLSERRKAGTRSNLLAGSGLEAARIAVGQ